MSTSAQSFRSQVRFSLPRALVIFVATLLGSVIALPSASRVLAEGLYADDAFYYFEIAKNIVNGNGVTFDTINTTNGFQVLWLVLLVPLAAVVTDPDSFVAATWWLSVVLASAAAALVFVLAIVVSGPGRRWVLSAIAISSLPFMPLWNGGMINGLETPAFSLAVIVSLLLLQFFVVSPSPLSAGLLSLGLTATVLGRLDGLLLLCLVAVAVFWRRVGSLAERLLVMALPAAVTLLYFIYNYLAFGSLSPVSGATKSIWGARALDAAVSSGASEMALRLGNLAWPKQYLGPLTDRLPTTVVTSPLLDAAVVVLILGVYAAIGTFYWRRRMPVLVLFQAFLLGKFLVYGLIQYGYANYIWYWTLDLIGLVLFVAVAVRVMAQQDRIGIRLAAAGVVAAFLVLAAGGNVLIERGRAWLSPDPTTTEIAEYAGSKHAATALNDSPVTEDLLMTSSDAGILGFYLDGPLVNMDGLVNGKERLEFTREYGQDQLPYLLAHPEFDGFVNWVTVGQADTVSERMSAAGFVEVPGFAECVEGGYGSVRNERGQIRLFLRPRSAERWACPTVSG